MLGRWVGGLGLTGEGGGVGVVGWGLGKFRGREELCCRSDGKTLLGKRDETISLYESRDLWLSISSVRKAG